MGLYSSNDRASKWLWVQDKKNRTHNRKFKKDEKNLLKKKNRSTNSTQPVSFDCDPSEWQTMYY